MFTFGKSSYKFGVVVCATLLILICTLQIGSSQSAQDSKERIIIENANNQVTDATRDTVKKYFNGDVRAYHKGNFIFCDSAIMIGNDLYAWGNVSIIQHDTTKIFCDTMKYFGDMDKASLKGSVILESGKNKLYTSKLDYDLLAKKGAYEEKAQLENGATILKSQRGIYDVANDKAYFYEKVSIDGEDFRMVNDSLQYETENEIATWSTPTMIFMKESTIYSEEGYYNVKTKSSEFRSNAQYTEGDKISTADTINYDDVTKEIVLNGHAKYSSSTEIAQAHKISYNRTSEVTILNGEACFENETNSSTGDYIYFDKINDLFKLNGRGTIVDSNMIITGDKLDYNKKTKIGKAVGDVFWQDTSSQTTIICDSLDYRGNDAYIKAINFKGKPRFSVVLDGDTLYMSADTLKSFQKIVFRDSLGNEVFLSSNDAILEKDTSVTKAIHFVSDTLSNGAKESEGQTTLDTLKLISTDLQSNKDTSTIMVNSAMSYAYIDTIKYLVGDNNVEIFKSDMQAVCDSLVFNSSDSIFTLMNIPVMWTDSTQMNGDTIYIYLKDKKVDHLDLIDNALVLSTEDLVYFNQIGGKKIIAGFLDGSLQKMKVDGNAIAIYYMIDDDDGYIGVNKTECSFMVFEFEDKKVSHIRSYIEPNSIIKPIEGTDHEALKLKGFEWKDNLRPISKTDLYD